MADEFHVSKNGAIVDKHGCVLYEAFCTEDMSPECRARLAQLHSENDELEWEGNTKTGVEGAWDILIREGLIENPAFGYVTPKGVPFV